MYIEAVLASRLQHLAGPEFKFPILRETRAFPANPLMLFHNTGTNNFFMIR